MGATAAFQWTAHQVLGKNNPADRAAKAIKASLFPPLPALPEIPVIPALPDVKKQNTDAGLAMTQAALAQRKKSAGAGGFASTILSSPTGAPAAPVIRKAAIGV